MRKTIIFIYLNIFVLLFSNVVLGQAFRPPKSYITEIPDKMIHETPHYSEDNHPSFLLRIRFPAMIEVDALERLAKAMLKQERSQEIFERMAMETPDVLDVDYYEVRIADFLNKSSFYALAFYQYIETQLPPNTVTLEPMTIALDEVDPRLFRMKSTSSRMPSVLDLDLFAKRNPYDMSTKKISSYGHTMGKFYQPLFSLFTSQAAWPGSRGVLAARPSLVSGFRWYQNQSKAAHYDYSALGNEWAGFVCSYRLENNVIVEKKSRSVQLQYPNLLAFDDVILVQNPSVFVQDVSPPIFKLLASFVHQGLAQVNHYLAVRNEWRDYIAGYDAGLASQWPRYPLSDQQIERLELLKKFMGAERQFIATQDKRYAESAMEGDHGVALQKQLLAEQNVIEAMADMAAQYRRAGWMQALQEVSQTVEMYADQRSGQYSPDVSTAVSDFVDTLGEVQADKARSQDMYDAVGESHVNVLSAFQANFRDIPEAIHSTNQNITVEQNNLNVTKLEDLRRQLSTVYVSRFGGSAGELKEACRVRESDDGTTQYWTGHCKDVEKNPESGFGMWAHRYKGLVVRTSDGIDAGEKGFTGDSVTSYVHGQSSDSGYSNASGTSCDTHAFSFDSAQVVAGDDETYIYNLTNSSYFVGEKRKRKLNKKQQQVFDAGVEQLREIRSTLIAHPE